ncbi:MAG TPA: hypothetical protein VFK06_15660 [Candidatus Angelobacter sp.]|nr:hypothetical protein [Candidatus Angelobacter sp.]
MSPRSGHGGKARGRSSGKKQSGRSSRTTARSSSRGKSGGRTSAAKTTSAPRASTRSGSQANRTFAQGRGRTSQVLNRVLTDHDEIRQWAEERQAQPAWGPVTGSSQHVGMIRLDFSGYTGEQSLEPLEPIEWDEFFSKFDESNLALVVEDETASGERSNFNKLIKRETAARRKKAA